MKSISEYITDNLSLHKVNEAENGNALSVDAKYGEQYGTTIEPMQKMVKDNSDLLDAVLTACKIDSTTSAIMAELDNISKNENIYKDIRESYHELIDEVDKYLEKHKLYGNRIPSNVLYYSDIENLDSNGEMFPVYVYFEPGKNGDEYYETIKAEIEQTCQKQHIGYTAPDTSATFMFIDKANSKGKFSGHYENASGEDNTAETVGRNMILVRIEASDFKASKKLMAALAKLNKRGTAQYR